MFGAFIGIIKKGSQVYFAKVFLIIAIFWFFKSTLRGFLCEAAKDRASHSNVCPCCRVSAIKLLEWILWRIRGAHSIRFANGVEIY